MTPGVTHGERVLRARIAANAMHSKNDGRRITHSARRVFLDRFELEVDPNQALSTNERAQRAYQARRSYFCSLALKSAKARRDRKTRT